MRLVEDYVPTSYADLFNHYYPFMVKLVKRMGIDGGNAEDVASTILIKLLEKDALNYYDPSYISEHSGVKRRAVFRSFLSGFVVSYVRHYRDRQQLLKQREVMSANQLVSEPGTSSPAEWITVFGPTHTDDYESLHYGELVSRIKAQLKSYVPKSKADKSDLPLLFDMILLQMEETGSLNVLELAELFGVSKPTIYAWVTKLQQEILEVL